MQLSGVRSPVTTAFPAFCLLALWDLESNTAAFTALTILLTK